MVVKGQAAEVCAHLLLRLRGCLSVVTELGAGSTRLRPTLFRWYGQHSEIRTGVPMPGAHF